MKSTFTINVFIVCGLFILIGVSALVFSLGATSNQPALASAAQDYSVPKIEARVVEVHTIEYVDRPVIEIKSVEVISKVPVKLRNFESLDEMKEWLAAYGKSTTALLNPVSAADCDDFALGLQQRAISDGYLVSLQIIYPTEYNLLFTSLQLPPETLHAINLAIIGNDAYYIEPQTGEVVLAAHLD